MSKLIAALFPQGHRKVMVNLVILGIGVAIEKMGGGLSDNLQTMLIAVAAIFTGGNVLTNVGGVLGGLKGTKVGQMIEDILPGDQGLGAQQATAGMRDQLGDMQEFLGGVDARYADLEKKLAVQAQNMGQVVQILNTMRGTPNVAPAAPRQP